MLDSSQPGIVDAAYYLPGEPVDVRQWGPKVGLSSAMLARLEENRCRYFHQSHAEDDCDLASGAVKRLLASQAVDPMHVDYLIHTQSQPFSIPAPPRSVLSELAARFRFRPRLAFGLGQLACAGIANAIEVARRLLEQDPAARHALVVTADRVFGGPVHRVRADGASLQSDGASAVLLGREQVKARFRDAFIRNFSRLAEGPSSASMNLLIGKLSWVYTRRVLFEAQQRLGFPVSTLGALLPTNADAPYWKRFAPQLGIDYDRVYLENVGRRGHACCADFAINLVDTGFERLARGETVLCLSQSNVGAYGALTLSGVAA